MTIPYNPDKTDFENLAEATRLAALNQVDVEFVTPDKAKYVAHPNGKWDKTEDQG